MSTTTFGDPVFVLCNGRSGSTLLRFLLDAHPDLACPPETNLPGLCVQLATVWSLIEGAPLAANRGDEPPDIPQAAIAGVRDTMDRMVGSYLARRGKKRYCDKSLGTARFTELLLRVYPDARFLCMYRHPMDVIASGVEASPWGLTGYGFEPYIAATPGNSVMALANFWADYTRTTLAAEQQFADKCLRVRYEDLVTDPEEVAARIFGFLGVEAVPGISQSCFSAERERFGPADYKIWYTSRITTDSVGRGWSVPAQMIAPQLLEVVNELAGKLGYLTVDGEWGSTAPPGDLRASSSQADSGITAAVARPVGSLRSRRLGDRLQTRMEELSGQGLTEWLEPYGRERFVAVALTGDSQSPAEYWTVDFGAATVTPAGREAQKDSDWDMVGSADVWEDILDGKVNLSVALRSCQLRYCDNDDSTPLSADTRIGILARLLGLVSWQ